MGAMNELIDAAAVERLRGRLAAASPGLALARLAAVRDELAGLGSGADDAGVRAGLAGLGAEAGAPADLSLRERTDRVSAALVDDLPVGYAPAAAVIRRALADPGFAGWTIWPVGEAVTTLALATSGAGRVDAFDDAMRMMAELTPRLTAEFPIRRLLEADLPRALGIVQDWTRDPDPHVRRLASEGTRAYLPWAIRVRALLAQPEATIPILDALYRDESDYVRRSVANHLNDLARTNADLVVATAARWSAEPDENTAWIVRHALRTLVKKAHPGALALQGFAPVTVTVSDPVLRSGTVVLPGSLDFSFTLTNDGDAAALMAVDYVVHFVKSNGTQAEKVFKLTSATLSPGETVALSKRHALRQMTTRVHYAGTHSLELQVNGRRHTRTDFEVAL